MVDTGDLKSPAYGVPVRVRPRVPSLMHPSSSGLGHHPFTVVTPVRIRLGVPVMQILVGTTACPLHSRFLKGSIPLVCSSFVVGVDVAKVFLGIRK